MAIERVENLTSFHRDRRRNLLDNYLTESDWLEIDSSPGEWFVIMDPKTSMPQEFSEKDTAAAYAFARRTNRYVFSRRIFNDLSQDKYSLSIMGIGKKLED